MPFDFSRARELLQSGDLPKLFVEELGWEPHRQTLLLRVGTRDFTLAAIAEKRGFTAWLCESTDGKLSDHATRLKLDRELTQTSFEHVIIFTSGDRQSWMWVRREPGQPARARTHEYLKGQPGDSLLQKLQQLFVSLDEEEAGISITEIAGRARAAFDVERVTKRFYEEFRKQHAAFLKFITGIPNQGDHEWYASVMLNRLMFLYFVQRKGFLDGDRDYLRNRLDKLRSQHGKDKFYSFYRYFLLRLFHEGLGAKDRKGDLEKLIGRVPYLNGGIFDVHKLERAKKDGGYGDAIQIPDTAFEAIFDYFDRYQWHLDERPLRADNEINPDVLGYIFEKYINQKQMGAYYTKEDITGYIGQNTILPFLFDKVAQSLRSGPGAEALEKCWQLLRDDPDRYIYPAVRHGISWNYSAAHPDQGTPLEKEQPLPADIAAGLNPTGLRDPVPAGAMPDTIPTLKLRKAWNRPAPATHGLPTEIWRETIARRQRCAELRKKLAAGEVRTIADFITLNLDIRRFALDVISRCESPELLAAFWHALAGRPPQKSNDRPQPGITILDPTCGSGAFLFAALGILEPLYEACLDRMDALLCEALAALPPEKRELSPKGHPKLPHGKMAEFTGILDQVAAHPSERYFIFKTIILHNLYGVDLMEEAVEICKLRLFLKLAAQVEPNVRDKNLGIEPLPDIDFNIRAGNTLVGYATRAELEEVGRSDLMLQMEVGKVLEAAEDAAAAYDTFVRSQLDGENPAEFKRRLNEKFGHAREQCDRFLAESYAIGLSKQPQKFAAWKQSHQPFHWFVEFFGIIQGNGGFDVIIGNPPYFDLKAGLPYKPNGYTTLAAKNLYPLLMERCIPLVRISGRLGLIVPVSSISTEGYSTLQDLVLKLPGHFSSYDDRPARLFEGLEHIQLTIHLLENRVVKTPEHFTTECYRWSSVERSHLFPTIEYERFHEHYLSGCLPKISSKHEHSVLNKSWSDGKSLGSQTFSASEHKAYYSRKVHNFLQALDFVPKVYDGRGNLRPPSELKALTFAKKLEAQAAFCILNSTLFRWFINVFTDCRHVNKREADGFRCNLDQLLTSYGRKIASLSEQLSLSLNRNSEYREMRFRHDHLKVQCIIPKHSKPIIDEIDCVLASHYGFTAEELDFIINYDIKYRLGRGGEEEE